MINISCLLSMYSLLKLVLGKPQKNPLIIHEILWQLNCLKHLATSRPRGCHLDFDQLFMVQIFPISLFKAIIMFMASLRTSFRMLQYMWYVSQHSPASLSIVFQLFCTAQCLHLLLVPCKLCVRCFSCSRHSRLDDK